MRALSKVSVALFDQRWDGKADRTYLGICLPSTQTLLIFSLTRRQDAQKKYETLETTKLVEMPAISIAPIRATRPIVYDALIVKPGGEVCLLTHGFRQIHLQLEGKDRHLDLITVDNQQRKIVGVEHPTLSSITFVYSDMSKARTSIDLVPTDAATAQALQVLAQTLPAQNSFELHQAFLHIWSSRRLATSKGVEFDCFEAALALVFHLEGTIQQAPKSDTSKWQALSFSSSYSRFCSDPALIKLKMPSDKGVPTFVRQSRPPHNMLAPILYALHSMGEDMRIFPHRHESLLRLASLICRIALIIRPEWADYWKRLCPDAMHGWPSSSATGEHHPYGGYTFLLILCSYRAFRRSYTCMANRYVRTTIRANQ